jgi:hypothetical protein
MEVEQLPRHCRAWAKPPWLTVDWVLSQFGEEKIPSRQTLPPICAGGDFPAFDLGGNTSAGVVG